MDKPIAKKVLLIGWDAADWKMLNPLLDAGLMPTLNQFVNEGVIGNAATLSPILSPILWNSIATGKLPQKHGILGFLEPMPDGSGVRPVNSTSRKCKALWNILNQNGLRSHVVGWFASQPAEPINGVYVSNQFTMAGEKREPWPFPEGSVHPERLAKTLAELRVHPHEIEGFHLQPLIRSGAEIDQTAKEEQQRLNAIRKLLAECASVQSVATWIMENEPWDFMAVYFEAIDMMGHHFMPFHPPQMEGISDKNFSSYKDVMTGIYRFHDMMLERLLQLAGPDTVVILLSDHGFYSDHLRPAVGSVGFNDPVAWHRSHGIFGMRGPGILKDERVYGTSILDVAPTVLTLFGLPIGEDMDGKVLIEAFESPPEIKRISSWETVKGDDGMHQAEMRQDPVAAQQAIQQLVDLGYVEQPSADAQKAIENVSDNLQYNLAISLLHDGDLGEAEKIMAALFSRHSGEHRFAFLLAQIYFKAGKFAEVRKLLEGFVKPEGNTPGMELMLASLRLAQGENASALTQLRNVEAKAPTLPQLQIRIGHACLRLRKWQEAVQAFQKALEVDGDNATACLGMSTALMRTQQLERSAEFALRAIGLQHFFPAAHFQLGAVLARLNQPARAAQAFEHSLAMNPNMPVTHRYLARLYYRLGNMKKCHEHQEAFSKLRAGNAKLKSVFC